MFNSSLRLLGAATMLVLMVACSPSLDWREMSAADGSVRVAFPAKPRSETRPLPVEGRELPFTLTAATVKGAVFAVGYLDLPANVADDTEKREAYRRALEDSLTRNLQAGDVHREQVPVRRVAGSSTLQADELELHGEPAGEPAWLLARILLVNDRLIEVAAVGTESALSNETARTFVDSLRVY